MHISYLFNDEYYIYFEVYNYGCVLYSIHNTILPSFFFKAYANSLLLSKLIFHYLLEAWYMNSMVEGRRRCYWPFGQAVGYPCWPGIGICPTDIHTGCQEPPGGYFYIVSSMQSV